jgi:GNAT superfamily N-acetyltransferase
VSDELEVALELDRRLYRRGAQTLIPLAHGYAVRHRELAAVYFLNAVTLPAPLPGDIGAAEVVELADRGLGGAGGVTHRLVVLDDDAAAQRVAPELTGRGWEQQRTLFMALRTPPKRAPREPRARELSDSELQALQLAAFAEENYGPHSSPGLPAALVEAQAALRAGTTARGFGAGGSGEPASMCTLFLDPDVDGLRVGMVEQVATRRAHREQGLARAVMSAAIHAGGEWGAEMIVVPADADDWPQLFYAGLGFAPIGQRWTFTLRDRALDGSG